MPNTRLPPGLRMALEYSEELDRGHMVSEMDGGPGKQRPKYSRAIKTRQAKLVAMSFQAKQAFNQWWDTDLNGGNAWFDFADPFLNQTIEARFTMPKLKWHMVARDLWESTVTIQTLGI